MIKQPIVAAGVLLAAFAVGGTGLVAFTHKMTDEKIAENERNALLNSLSEMVPADSIDNDIVTDTVTVSDPEHLGLSETTVYLGRKEEQPVAAVFTSVVPDGYSGPIKLLVAVKANGELGGVRVVSHKETPGLGDKIEIEKDDWIYSFDGLSLGNPPLDQWKVKRDGGIFDQFTGATITPRSIVKAVKNTLIYYQTHSEKLFQDSAAASNNGQAPSESGSKAG